MQVSLSSGETVQLRAWKHKAQKVFSRALKEGVCYRRDLNTGDMEPVEEVPAANFDRAYEAVLPVLIERIDNGGAEVPYSEAWLDELKETDYEAIERAVYQIKEAAKASADKSS